MAPSTSANFPEQPIPLYQATNGRPLEERGQPMAGHMGKEGKPMVGHRGKGRQPMAGHMGKKGKPMVGPGLGTPFFSVRYDTFFSVLKKERSILFRSFPFFSQVFGDL